ncbi:DUF6504 family protein [Pseudarthrobacter enclensis]|uniref:DUF6504 domain-containing protein n=1 Tax=Pseudarthrobacter enclensis TaxID=993070 RepID=A0ABT9RSZ3_9MICC|nr:DUF6504 family protein [Pseudarthrobacter enclensis]MDP9887906.1 hypothetical protein [Pseudarthrobacter enclensis]
MGMFSESVDVVCSASGQPESLTWAGRPYALCAEPVRWYERRQWWAEDSRAPLGSGAGVVDHEIWRVQVLPVGRTSRPGAPEDAAGVEPLTLDLTRHIRSGRWRLLRIHDGLRHRTA